MKMARLVDITAGIYHIKIFLIALDPEYNATFVVTVPIKNCYEMTTRRN